MAISSARGYLVQAGDGRTNMPVAVFGDEATANACVEELRGNKGSRVAMHWGEVEFEVAVPSVGGFEVIEVSVVAAGQQPTTRVISG